jgi:hypothetical protein
MKKNQLREAPFKNSLTYYKQKLYLKTSRFIHSPVQIFLTGFSFPQEHRNRLERGFQTRLMGDSGHQNFGGPGLPQFTWALILSPNIFLWKTVYFVILSHFSADKDSDAVATGAVKEVNRMLESEGPQIQLF